MPIQVAERVWIVKAAGHNFDKAKSFGSLNVILSEESSAFNLAAALKACQEALAQAKEDDYIIPSGPPSLNMLFMAEWAKRFAKARFLLFHARTGEYVVRDVQLR